MHSRVEVPSRLALRIARPPPAASALSPAIGRGQRLVDPDVGRDDGPGRTTAREDRDLRAEGRRVVERARVDVELLVLADFAAEHEAAADWTEIAHRVSAACGFRFELAGGAADAHGAARKPQEGNEARAGRLLTIGAVAMACVQRLAIGFVAQRAAKTAARVPFLVAAHRPPARLSLPHKTENRDGLMVGFGCWRRAQIRAARLVYLARDAQTLRPRADRAAAAAPLPAEWIRRLAIPARSGQWTHGVLFCANRVMHTGQDDAAGHFVAAFGHERGLVRDSAKAKWLR